MRQPHLTRLLFLAACAAPVAAPAAAQDFAVVGPTAAGTARFLPEVDLLERMPIGDRALSGYARTSPGDREIRRGLLEFQVPGFATSIVDAKLWIEASVDPGANTARTFKHELWTYDADLAVTKDDFQAPGAFVQTLAVDPRSNGAKYRVDVTDLVEARRGSTIGFRIQVSGDLGLADYEQLGHHVGDLQGNARLEIVTARPVSIDVMPGACPNLVFLDAKPVLDEFGGPAGRMIEVAIAGDSTTDVSMIDPVSVRLMGVAPVRSLVADVTDAVGPFEPPGLDCRSLGTDATADLLLRFPVADLYAAIVAERGRPLLPGEPLAVRLTGSLREELGGGAFEGMDAIVRPDPGGDPGGGIAAGGSGHTTRNRGGEAGPLGTGGS